MPGRIEETTLRQPICDECGPIAPLRERPLRDAENELAEHDRHAHDNDQELE